MVACHVSDVLRVAGRCLPTLIVNIALELLHPLPHDACEHRVDEPDQRIARVRPRPELVVKLVPQRTRALLAPLISSRADPKLEPREMQQ